MQNLNSFQKRMNNMGIEMTLIEKKGQPVKTQLKIKKTDVPSFRMLDGLKPDKTTRYYNYYILDGDLLNPRKNKDAGTD